MKKFLLFIPLAVALLSSCDWFEIGNHNPVPYQTLATARPVEDGHWYLKINDTTAMYVANQEMQEYPKVFDGNERRTLVSFYILPDEQQTNIVDGYLHTITISANAFSPIRTKAVIEATAETKPSEDGIDLVLSKDYFPHTDIVDGYLDLSCFYVGSGRLIVDIIAGLNPEDPYELLVSHNSEGDFGVTGVYDFITYPLKNLPDTHGETVKLTVKWQSRSTGRMEQTQFDYCTRTDW